MPPYQMKEMNDFVMHIYAEKHAALQELNRVINEKNKALEDRNEAIKLRDEVVAARDIALRERDRVITALQFQENSMNGGDLEKRGIKRVHQTANNNQVHGSDHYPSSEISSDDKSISSKVLIYMCNPVLKAPTLQGLRGSDVCNISPVSREVVSNSSSYPHKKVKLLSEDLNIHVSTEDDSHNIDLMNQINFDEGAVPPPMCSCTGVPRQCYKSGNGGWQSSCCTITLSVYPLPQLPNKRHSRMGGRKMSGNVFGRLLTRLAEEGHDLSVPVDLKSYWAKHGTNRYITVK